MLKRCVSFLLAVLILVSLSTSAFADSTSSEGLFPKEVDTKRLSVNEGVMPLVANTQVGGFVGINDAIYLYPVLNPYVGFTKEIIVNTNSASTSGLVFLYLYDPKGKIVSHDWIGDVSGVTKWKVTLPSSGTWKLQVVAHANNVAVVVNAKWAD